MKYHVALNGTEPKAGGFSICGAKGTGNRFNVVTLSKIDFLALSEISQCKKCLIKLEGSKPSARRY